MERIPMLPGLENKCAIVTGGGTGIGLAIARALAQQGVKVAIADVDDKAASKAAASITDATPFTVDVRIRDSVEKCFAAIDAAFGGFDILCANAGVSRSEERRVGKERR